MKDKKNIIELSSDESVQRVLKVNSNYAMVTSSDYSYSVVSLSKTLYPYMLNTGFYPGRLARSAQKISLTKTSLYNFDLLKPHFYSKTGFYRGIDHFLICQNKT